MIKEEAIEILSDMRAEHNIFSDDEEEATRYHALSWAIQALNEQQRTGRWIKNDNGTYSCDQCHSWIPNEQHYYARYCIFCGARMEEQE